MNVHSRSFYLIFVNREVRAQYIQNFLVYTYNPRILSKGKGKRKCRKCKNVKIVNKFDIHRIKNENYIIIELSTSINHRRLRL